MLRFAEEFDLVIEVGQLPMQKVFSDCTHYETVSGKGVDGEMSFESFQLALLVLAQKVHVGTKESSKPLDRVVVLFQRLNGSAGTTALSSALKLGDSPLFPLATLQLVDPRPRSRPGSSTAAQLAQAAR